MTGRRLAAAAVTALAVAALSGCSGDDPGQALGDAASSLGSEASCQVAEQTVNAAVREARQAVGDIGTRSAQTRLEGLRDSLTITSESLSGPVEDGVLDARDALDDLAAAAKEAVGSRVDTDEVDDATSRLRDAATEVADSC